MVRFSKEVLWDCSHAPACWQALGDKLKLIAEQVRPTGSVLVLLKGGFNNAEWDSAIYLIAVFVAITSNLFYVDIRKKINYK